MSGIPVGRSDLVSLPRNTMPISGLVVSLVSDPELRAEAIASIEREPCIETGVLQSNRMAIVLDTPTSDEDKRLWCWLSSLPGVVFVDVAMVAFDEEPESSQPNARCQPPLS